MGIAQCFKKKCMHDHTAFHSLCIVLGHPFCSKWCRLHINVLRAIMTSWCQRYHKIPDTQFGFYPGRSTLQPIFILRHVQHAAQTLHPHGSSRLHAAFIDFKQAYDCVPRQKLWQHLENTGMPVQLSIIKNLYQDDEYILVDGDKKARACVLPVA